MRSKVALCFLCGDKCLPCVVFNITRGQGQDESARVAMPMDDLRFRKNFNLGITKDIFGKKLSKLEQLQSLVAKCCKIRKVYSSAKLANLYTFLLRAEIGN
jgi:hypothetical protein